MKLLKRIELNNFQSHKYTDIYFDDGVNVIIGSSDSGKTAIIRGIKWVLFNEPSGNDFMRKGTNDTFVTLYFNNNLIVKRGRTKSKNYYEITLPDGTPERFEGFGTKVPDEVKEFTGVDKVKLDGNNLISLSISDQLESPFLLTESPAIKAVAIGKIAGVESIDLALNKLSKDIREIDNQKKSLEKEKKIQEDKLKNFEYLADEKKELDRINSIIKEINDKKSLLNKMNNLNNKVKEVNLNINNINLFLNKYEKINFLEQKLKKLTTKVERYSISKELFFKYEYLTTNISKHNNILNNTENISILSNNITYLEELNIKFNTLNRLYNKHIYLNSSINKYNKIIESDVSIPLEQNYVKLIGLLDKYNNLNNIFNKLNVIKSRIDNGSIYIKKFDEVNVVEANYKKLYDKFNMLLKLNSYFELSENINAKIQSNNIYKDKLTTDFKKLLDKYIDLLNKSSTCPYCYSELDEEHLNKIITEYEV